MTPKQDHFSRMGELENYLHELSDFSPFTKISSNEEIKRDDSTQNSECHDLTM